jgi:hypothetical protein
MRHWRLRKKLARLTTFLVLIGLLGVMGCEDEENLGDFEEATAQDFATNTLSFQATFLDPSFQDQRVTLVFGAADNNTVPFTMRFSGLPTTVLTGTGIVGSLQLRIDAIEVGGEAVTETRIGNVVFTVGTVAYTLGAEIRGDGELFEFRLTNPQTGETLFLNNA